MPRCYPNRVIWLRNLACLAACAAAFGAQAQIAFRAAASASAAAPSAITHVNAGAVDDRNNCGSITPSVPAGLAGDLLIALVNVRENNATVTMTGWNLLFFDQYPGVGDGAEMKAYIYYRIAAGGDTATVTQSGTCDSIGGQVSRFRGVDQTQPFYNVPISGGNMVRQDSNNVDTGTEATAGPNDMMVVASFVNDNRNAAAGVGWSESFDTGLNISEDLAIALDLTADAGAARGKGSRPEGDGLGSHRSGGRAGVGAVGRRRAAERRGQLDAPRFEAGVHV